MNPGYAGRSNLPDNLKKLFRSVAMTKPDKEMITQVMLYSQGFQTAKDLAAKTVPFFDECLRVLSRQTHYDFGLRALKSVLVTSGNLKRLRYQESGIETDVEEIEAELEAKLILQALHETVAPKLVGNDVQKLSMYLLFSHVC
jgi:dynein heavy chain 1, cytosolic